MGSIDWYLIAACLGLLCLSAPAAAFAQREELRSRLTAGVLAIAACGGLLRLFTVAPAFVHAEFYGPGIVNTILELAPDHLGNHHGLAASFTLGKLALLFGRSVEGILRSNLLLATLATLPLAALARRLLGTPAAALYTAVLWSSSPLVSRLACSEDAHVAGVLFGAIALVAIDVAAATGSWAALATAAASAVLMVQARQTFYAWVPVLAALWFDTGRAPTGPTFRRAGWLVVGAVVALTAVQLLWRQASELTIVYVAQGLLAARPAALWDCVTQHPALDWRRLSPVVVGLALPGAIRVARSGRSSVALLGGLALALLTSLPAAWPSPGASWGFRLPAYTLLLLVVAAGATWLEEGVPLRLKRFSWLPVAALLAAASAFAGGTAENREPSAELEDYRFLRDQLATLQQTEPVGLVVAPRGFPHPRYAAPQEVARLLRLPTATLSDARAGRLDAEHRWYFYDGLGCSAGTVFERLYPELATEGEVSPRLLSEPDNLALVLFDSGRGFGVGVVGLPSGDRADCLEARAATEGAGLRGPLLRPRQDPPSAIFAAQEVATELRRFPTPAR